MGARRCSLDGRPTALVFYALRDPSGDGPDIASLFAFEGHGEDWSAMRRLPGGNRVLCHAHRKGVSVLVWERMGLVYALATGLDEPELLAMAEALS